MALVVLAGPGASLGSFADESGSDDPRKQTTPATTQRAASVPVDDNPFGNRGKQRRDDALETFGGDKKTERAVADGLAWLAAHQRRDGVWDRVGFNRLCPANDRCSQVALAREQKDCNVGVSALAALAFLGAGYTHENGRYCETLERVFEYILAQQDAGGSFSTGSGLQMYNDAIATLAVAEAYALTRDPVFAEPLARAVRHIEKAQQPGGGWDYLAESKTGRNDTSVTGWAVMALKAAQAADVAPSVETRFRLAAHFDRATESDGRVWYADKGTGTGRDRQSSLLVKRYGPAMTAIGLYARGALGYRLDDQIAVRQTALLSGDLPSLARLRGADPTGLHNEYYWYYGTLATFNMGGDDWRRWNQALRRTVMEYQERPTRRDGTRRHAYGSWPAFGRNWGKWGRTGSRIYSTAINVLTLEIYYRYVPAYMSPRGLIGPAEMRKRIARVDPREHGSLLDMTLRLHADTAEPVLLDLLGSPDAIVRLEAALALTGAGSPIGKAVLVRLQDRAAGKDRRRIRAAIQAFVGPPAGIVYGKVTLTDLRAGMLLFDTEGKPVYYRQPLVLLRVGRLLGSR